MELNNGQKKFFEKLMENGIITLSYAVSLGYQKPCEYCGGEGTVFRPILVGEADEDPAKCPDCGGSGKAW